MSPRASRATPRTFTESLRTFSRDDLTELLRRRPDLTYPAPHDVTDLAARACSATSVGRALGQLDAWTLVVLQALAAQGEAANAATAATLLGDVRRRDVAAAIDTVRRLGLVWGADAAVHLVREVRLALGPHPGGLAPPSPRDPDHEQIPALLSELDAESTQMLHRLVWGPPTGVVTNAAQRRGDNSPIGRLLAAGILQIADTDTVILARSVAWALREPRRLVRDLPGSSPPAPTGGPGRGAAIVTNAAIGAAFELVADTEAVGDLLAAGRFRMLRDGGLGLRDLNQMSQQLHQSSVRTVFVLECAHAAGLINAAGNLTILPTAAFDTWASSSSDDRWLQLARGWLASRRWFARSSDPGHHVLGSESSLRGAPEIRQIAVECLHEAAGQRLQPSDLAAMIGWHRPGWARNDRWPLSTVVAELRPELEALGLLALDEATPLLSAVRDQLDVLPSELAELFPAPVSTIIVQADLTAVAPGPLTYEVAAELSLLADRESRGHGGVHRFSSSSLRRAFDAGWSHQEISAWLTTHSSTPIPQPLEYLITDTARQYGSVRVGPAWSYVRTEDEAQATAILSHPDAGPLGLRALAPGVLIAAADPDEVVALLRQVGLHPAAEDDSGHTVPAPAPMRASPVRPPERPHGSTAESAVAHLLAAEARTAAAAESTEDVLAALVRAQQAGLPVELSYVDATGSRTITVASPMTIASGSVRLARPTGGPFTVPLARISGAVVQDRIS